MKGKIEMGGSGKTVAIVVLVIVVIGEAYRVAQLRERLAHMAMVVFNSYASTTVEKKMAETHLDELDYFG